MGKQGGGIWERPNTYPRRLARRGCAPRWRQGRAREEPLRVAEALATFEALATSFPQSIARFPVARFAAPKSRRFSAPARPAVSRSRSKPAGPLWLHEAQHWSSTRAPPTQCQARSAPTLTSALVGPHGSPPRLRVRAVVGNKTRQSRVGECGFVTFVTCINSRRNRAEQSSGIWETRNTHLLL